MFWDMDAELARQLSCVAGELIAWQHCSRAVCGKARVAMGTDVL